MSITSEATDVIHLEFTDHDLVPALLGEHDRNLARIEQKLQVSLSCFANKVTIGGEKEAVVTAQSALTSLYRRLEDDVKTGKRLKTLDIGTVDAAVKWAQNTADAANRDCNGFNDRSAFVPTWKRTIQPRSPNQHRYIQALAKDELVLGLGPAGTGKTYLAVAMAVSMLMERRVERLILSRPAVEAGERLGFLPGDMKDKVDPYLRPLYDALYDMMPGEQVERRLAAGEIEIAPLAFMRGRTLANSFIILDEAQNTTPTQMKMFLTRLGESSRMAITGDPSQIDLPFGAKSGLTDAINVLDRIPDISLIEFTARDVVRHPLVTKIVNAYSERDVTRLDDAAR